MGTQEGCPGHRHPSSCGDSFRRRSRHLRASGGRGHSSRTAHAGSACFHVVLRGPNEDKGPGGPGSRPPPRPPEKESAEQDRAGVALPASPGQGLGGVCWLHRPCLEPSLLRPPLMGPRASRPPAGLISSSSVLPSIHPTDEPAPTPPCSFPSFPAQCHQPPGLPPVRAPSRVCLPPRRPGPSFPGVVR